MRILTIGVLLVKLGPPPELVDQPGAHDRQLVRQRAVDDVIGRVDVRDDVA